MSSGNSRRFVPFTPKRDHVDPVAAEHVNRLQRISERLQKESIAVDDELFLLRALRYIEHRPECNVLWVDLLQDDSLWDWQRSAGVEYRPEERAVFLSEGLHRVGELTSFAYRSKGGARIRRLKLLWKGETPAGTGIRFFYSTDGVTFHPLWPDADLVDPPGEASSLVFRVRLERSASGVSPRLDALAVGFFDPSWDPELSLVGEGDQVAIAPVLYHSQLLGIGPDDHHPKIHRHTGAPGEPPKIDLAHEVTGILWWDHLPPELLRTAGILLPGETVLERDEQGRLIHILAPEGEDFLIYDPQTGRLSVVVNVSKGSAVVERLRYDGRGILTGLVREILQEDQLNLSQLGYRG